MSKVDSTARAALILGLVVAACTTQPPTPDFGTVGAALAPTPFICTGKKAIQCADGNPCTQDCYSKSIGGCMHVVLTGGPPPACSDGNVCTTADACVLGTCQGTATTGACNDGDPCTAPDACQGGACSGAPVACVDDDNPCTSETCNATTGACHDSLDGQACDDEDPCTSSSTCAGTTCQGTEDCDDLIDCTLDACGAFGCTHEPQHSACDDGVACTQDACNAVVGCQYEPQDLQCEDGLSCTFDTCELTGCQHEPRDEDCPNIGGGECEVCAPQDLGHDPFTGCVDICAE